MKDIEAIKAKIRKLLALAGNNPSAHEANVAMTMAHKLMAKFNLQSRDVTDIEEQYIDARNTMRSSGPWAVTICNWIGQLYFCKYYVTRHGKRVDTHIFVGKQSNVEMAQMISDYVIGIVHTGSIQASRTGGVPARNSFRNAAAQQIFLRCKSLIEAAKRGDITDETGTALVLASTYLVEQEKAKEYFESRHKVNKPRNGLMKLQRSHAEAARAGHEVGKSVAIQPQVKSKQTAAIT